MLPQFRGSYRLQRRGGEPPNPVRKALKNNARNDAIREA
jgi:hypothetical protein